MYSGLVPVLFLALTKVSVGQDCEDNTSIIWKITTSADGSMTDYKGCAALIAAHKYFCRKGEKIGGRNMRKTCCKSCKNVPEDVCADAPQIIYVGDDAFMCPELAAAHPAACDPDNNSNRRDVCCNSCKSVNTNCYDNTFLRYSAITSADGSTTKYADCASFIGAHPWYCREEAKLLISGANRFTREECCQSCKGISKNVCANQPTAINIGPKSYTCENLPKQWCDDNGLRQTCCKRCKELNQDQGCVDEPYSFPVVVDADGTVQDFYCADLIANYKYYCRADASITINGNPVFTREACCASCENIDEDICEDEPQSIKVTGTQKGNYDCAGLVALNPGFCDPTTSFSNDYPTTCCKSCQSVDAECYDHQGFRFRIWTSAGGQSATYTDCASLVEDYPWYCRADASFVLGGDEISTRDFCCDSCSSVSENVCADKPIRVRFLGQQRMCPSLIAAAPELCDPNFPGSNNYPSDCCASCQSVDADCYDQGTFSIRMWELKSGKPKRIKYDRCDALASKHPFICRSDSTVNIGGEEVSTRDICCDTCSSIDPDVCADNNGGRIEFRPPQAPKARFYLCSQLVPLYPALCDPDRSSVVSNRCCKACQSVDLSCVDDVTEISIPHLNLKKVSCATAISKYPGLCLYESSDQGLQDKCCASCQGAQLSCVDDPFVYGIFGPADDPTFKYCHQLGQPGSNAWRKNCCVQESGTYKQGRDKDGNQIALAVGCCAKCTSAQC